MPATNPRVSTVVDSGLLTWLRARARRQGISVSLLIRDLLQRLREEDEERYWVAEGSERLADFGRAGAVPHEDAWPRD